MSAVLDELGEPSDKTMSTADERDAAIAKCELLSISLRQATQHICILKDGVSVQDAAVAHLREAHATESGALVTRLSDALTDLHDVQGVELAATKRAVALQATQLLELSLVDEGGDQIYVARRAHKRRISASSASTSATPLDSPRAYSAVELAVKTVLEEYEAFVLALLLRAHSPSRPHRTRSRGFEADASKHIHQLLLLAELPCQCLSSSFPNCRGATTITAPGR